jgi:hypothetical protein
MLIYRLTGTTERTALTGTSPSKIARYPDRAQPAQTRAIFPTHDAPAALKS